MSFMEYVLSAVLMSIGIAMILAIGLMKLPFVIYGEINS